MATIGELDIGGQRAIVHDEGHAAGFFHTFDRFEPSWQPAERRKIRIFLPRDYAPSPRKYRVVYMNDGNTAFFRGGPANLSWDMAAALDSPGDDRVTRDVIVVAIDPINRNREYTHVPWGGPDCCGLEEYAGFVADDVKGFVDTHYATRTEATSAMMLGSSHGGLAAFYIASRRPDRFGTLAAFSPSFWVGLDQRTAFCLAEPAPQKTLAASELLRLLRPGLKARGARPRILLQWGLVRGGGAHNAEIEERATVRGREMAELLIEGFGYQPEDELVVIEDPAGEHNEITWGRHVPRALAFFAGR